jgi:hypothetical protein
MLGKLTSIRIKFLFGLIITILLCVTSCGGSEPSLSAQAILDGMQARGVICDSVEVEQVEGGADTAACQIPQGAILRVSYYDPESEDFEVAFEVGENLNRRMAEAGVSWAFIDDVTILTITPRSAISEAKAEVYHDMLSQSIKALQ